MSSKETATTTATGTRFPAAAARNESKTSPEHNENDFETPPLNHLVLHNYPSLPPLPRSPLNTIADPSQTHFDSHSNPKLGASRRFSFSNRLATPSKNASRFSLSGPVSRPVSVLHSELETTLMPHFELEEDESFWADHNVQVLIRVRPLSRMERVSQGLGRCLRQETAQTLVWLGHPETRFTFDHVACDTISQESLFRVAGLPMVENCLSGYNSCMFAYGQTGSGKTYTMMGEIYEIEGKLNEDCGLTPRIFEHLFKRIMVEEESRRDEQLKYSCKCSFLEIYNEQITDLLQPSSTNLQLREDLKKGVYVENLTEYNVRNVNDVVKLLLQGAANRKVAATHMNSESSRSHSVFTCTIESRWGKDSMTHFRFARLNLVDLAGSERQKSSGAEGDRLKEAANINKSLSTLGLVIMSLVDLAHGKHRHVPYRDSRLTFLLQDSLGGNSKTTIIANISPSICSANETLSTLKFAQRAKLIQNNAKVNEDTSGDINALQREIQQLKGHLSFLMKHNYVSRTSPSCVPSLEESRLGALSEVCGSLGDKIKTNNHGIQYVQKKIKRMEANLVGALRREKIAETAVLKLEAELQHVKCMVQKREEDAQHAKMMLRFRDEEIKRLKLLTDGMLSADKYLVQENKALLEEIRLLRARVDENPELTQLAVENNRLQEQLLLFQRFYEQGEQETLLAKVSELHNQLLDRLEGQIEFCANNEKQGYDSAKELEDCRIINSKLIRQVEELRMELKRTLSSSQIACDSVKSMSVQSNVADETSSYIRRNVEALQNHMDNKNVDGFPVNPSDVTEKVATDIRLLTEEMEREQVCSVAEQPNVHEKLVGESGLKLGNRFSELGDLDRQNSGQVVESSEEIDRMVLQAKLDGMTKDLQELRLLNDQFQEEQVLQLSCQQKAELIREQVEMETARTILQLQEEVAALQCKLDEKLCCMTQDNTELRKIITTKEEEIKAINMEWERATLELTGFLVEGSRSLKNVSCQIESIVCSFPQANVWISEHVERATKIYIEKEETILQLKRSLEDAQNMVIDLGQRLSSLKGATLALTELQHLDTDKISKEHVSMLFDDKIDMVRMLDRKLKLKEAEVVEVEKCANVAFVVINWLFHNQKAAHANEVESNIPVSTNPVKMANHKLPEAKADANKALEDAITHIELAKSGVFESKNDISAFYADIEMYLATLQTHIQEVSSACKEMVQHLGKEVHEIWDKYIELRVDLNNRDQCTIGSQLLQVRKYQKFEDQFHMLHQIRDELTKMNCRVKVIEDSIHAEVNVFQCLSTDGSIHAEAQSPDFSSSSSDFSTESGPLANKLDVSSFICWSNSPENISEQMVDLKSEDSTLRSSHNHSDNPNIPLKDFFNNEVAAKFLKRELGILFNDFNMLYLQLATLANKLNLGHCPNLEGCMTDSNHLIPSFESALDKATVGPHNTEKVVDDERIDHARSFLSKFEEANATIKEADFMVNTLVKANENANQLTGMWKQIGEKLMIERANLIEEVENLKSSISMKENENQLLHDQAHFSLVAISNSLSSLEECHMQMKSEEEELKAVYSDVFSMGRDMMRYISNSRLFLEDICSKIMEKDIVLFVLYECYLGEGLHAETGFPLLREVNKLQSNWLNGRDKIISTSGKFEDENVEGTDMSLSDDDLIYENLALKKELRRKEVLLEGLLFDFSLLQESISNTKDIKDETDKLVRSLGQVRHELELKTRQLDEILVQHKKLKCRLTDTEEALFISNSNLTHANETIKSFSEQNSELKMLLKDQYLKKSVVEEQLEEQREVVKSLEEEILQLSASIGKEFLSMVEDIEIERDQLKEEVQSLNNKLEMAYALVDEKEAIIVEARQVSEASKIYAEQKEEEVRILENSIEELESTINVLEKKVCEMDDEVERHRLIRDSLELELKALRKRLLTVENLSEDVGLESMNVEQTQNQISWQLHNKELELHQTHAQIKLLEDERAVQDKEIKQYKDYVTELTLHAEAQASQYQQKYKRLEDMVCEVKQDLVNPTNSMSALPTSHHTEKSSARPRGSSSPFRCLTSVVHHLNLEKDQELSAARLCIEELEALAASRQKEVCMLNTRLAAAESMTHDVIRDLLGVKLDMYNFANLVDQYQVKKLVEDTHQQSEDLLEKEQEIFNLRKQINDLNEERESCILEMNKREGDLLAVQISVEQLQERDRLLSAQNEMLRMDKTNLNKKLAELDDMVKKLLGTKSKQGQTHITPISNNQTLKSCDNDFSKRLEKSEKLLSRVNGELALYYKSSRDKSIGHGSGTSYRKDKTRVV